MKQMEIQQIMSNHVCVDINDSITSVREKIRECNHRDISVIENKKLVGIISRKEILHCTSTKSNLTAKSLMEYPVIYLFPECDVMDAAKKMLDAEIKWCPIVVSKYDLKIVGELKLIDILIFFSKTMKPKKKKVYETMTKNVIYSQYDDKISRIWTKLEEYGNQPIMKNGKLVGIITRKDFIEHGIRIERESKNPKTEYNIERIMTTPVITIKKDSEIELAINIIIEKNLDRLPVIENEKLVGIIDTENILKAYIH